MADEQPTGNGGNGAVTKYRVDRLEHRLKNIEQGCELVAKMGAKTNDDLNALKAVHTVEIQNLREDMAEVKGVSAEVPVLRTEVAALVDGWRAVRNAFLALAGGLMIVAATIIWQASS